jgi:hypothetical protein
MTENIIKEKLSNHFIGIVASNKAYMLDKPAEDYGEDFMLSRTILYKHPGTNKLRYTKDSRYIGLQLKCTTNNGVVEDENFLHYALEVKNYNDLVLRLSNTHAPMVLILFILPVEKADWIYVDSNQLNFKGRAFWYLPKLGSNITANIDNITVHIPRQNQLDISSFDGLFQQFYGN